MAAPCWSDGGRILVCDADAYRRPSSRWDAQPDYEPGITRKAIVSSSGYTAPARSKARYGVELLTLREWRAGERVYSFLSPNFSAAVETNLNGWLRPPDVAVMTDGGPDAGWPPSTEIVDNGTKTTLGAFIDRVVAQELSRMTHAGELRDLAPGHGRPIQQHLLLKPPLTVTFRDEAVRILGLQIEGDVFAIRKRETPVMKLLVNEETGEPHAACLVGLMPRTTFGAPCSLRPTSILTWSRFQ